MVKTVKNSVNFFVKAKHWQVFLLAFGAFPVVISILTLGQIILSALHIFLHLKWLFAGMIILIPVLLYSSLIGWQGAIGVNLSKKLITNEKFPFRVYTLFLFIQIVCAFTFIISLITIIYILFYSNVNPDSISAYINVWTSSLFTGVSIIASLYLSSTTAKYLKSVELNRRVNFFEYKIEMFLIFIFPIGIWLIQPRINKIFAAEPDTVNIPEGYL